MLGYGVRSAMAFLCQLRRASVQLWLTKGATATYSADWPCKRQKTIYGNGDDKLSYGEKLAMAHFSGYGGLKFLAMASKGRLRQLILLFG